MVDVKTAVANSIEFAKNLLGPERTMDIRLEEIESSVVDGRAVWLVTLSNSLIDDGPLASITAALGADARREYKEFTVAKEDGEVISMKIRLLATPTN